MWEIHGSEGSVLTNRPRDLGPYMKVLGVRGGPLYVLIILSLPPVITAKMAKAGTQEVVWETVLGVIWAGWNLSAGERGGRT